MQKQDIKIGDRLYHAMFGWCTVTHPVLGRKVGVDLEADEIEYYKIGHGYMRYKREESGFHFLITPIDNLFPEPPDKLPKKLALAKGALNPKLTFWEDKK